MKILKALRRRKQKPANPEKVFRGFVRALGELRPVKQTAPPQKTGSSK
jgi:hypothetical protein